MVTEGWLFSSSQAYNNGRTSAHQPHSVYSWSASTKALFGVCYEQLKLKIDEHSQSKLLLQFSLINWDVVRLWQYVRFPTNMQHSSITLSENYSLLNVEFLFDSWTRTLWHTVSYQTIIKFNLVATCLSLTRKQTITRPMVVIFVHHCVKMCVIE